MLSVTERGKVLFVTFVHAGFQVQLLTLKFNTKNEKHNLPSIIKKTATLNMLMTT